MDALNSILESQKALEATFSQRFMELDAALKTASPHSHPTISSLSKEVSCFKEQVSSMLHLLRQQILDISSTVDTIEMRHRKKFLMFNGIPESDGEDIAGSVATLCQSTLQLPNVSREAILVCYRIGVPKNDRPRNVLVRFKDYQVRTSVWSSKKALKGSQVTVSEFLTKQRQSLFIEARKHFGIRRVWTMDGNIYVKLPNNIKERLSSDSQLQTLKSQHAAVVISGPARNRAPKPLSVPAPGSVSAMAAAPAPASSVPAAIAAPAAYVAGSAKPSLAGTSKKGEERRTKRPT